MTTASGAPPSQKSSRASDRMAGETRAPKGTRADDDGLGAFLSVRPRLFGIAYRMLRSAAEAEDIVQDVWLRWQTTNRRIVRDARAFLATMTTRLAINVVQSARARREMCAGSSLPEPVDTSADPGVQVERSEALQVAVLVLQETLSPTERAAYVLREAFDCPYREIAGLLRLREVNTRQLVTRARKHVADGRPSPAPASHVTRRLLARSWPVRAGHPPQEIRHAQRLIAGRVERQDSPSTAGRCFRA